MYRAISHWRGEQFEGWVGIVPRLGVVTPLPLQVNGRPDMTRGGREAEEANLISFMSRFL